MLGSFRKVLLGVSFAGVLLAGLGVAPAFATGPWWHLSYSELPASLAAGGEGTIVARAVNVGDGTTSGAFTFSDTLPAGVTAQSVQFFSQGFQSFDLAPFSCETQPGQVRCTSPEFLPVVNPYEMIEMQIGVRVAPNAVSGVENRVAMAGGGAPSVSAARPFAIRGGAVPFGVENVELVPEEEGGGLDARAGSHPFQLSSTITFNQTEDQLKPPALVRDVGLELPAGLVGNATLIPRCGDANFAYMAQEGRNLCPDDTVVGVAVVRFDSPGGASRPPLLTRTIPLFNLVPSHGEPARFGFETLNAPVILDTSVRSGGDYGVTVAVSNITQLANPVYTQVSFWGAPGDPRHDQSRGWDCVAGGFWNIGSPCHLQNQANPVPLLTLPTSCTLPFTASLEGDAWPTKANPEGLRLIPGEYSLRDGLGREVGLTGCDQLPFGPLIQVTPDTNAASTPTGLTASVHIPQDTGTNPNGLAEAALKDTTVVLPEGVQINPSSADGLEACSMGQVGYTGMENGIAQFTADPVSCPDASKVGTVDEIKSPLLANALTGSIYLAAQGANPFGSLIALYIVAEDSVSGVRAKLAGNVSLDPVTGRLTGTFDGAPQVPVEDIKLHFFGGSRAPLSTPALCGTYTTAATFTPWSGNAPVGSSSSFPIDSGLGGTGCLGGLGFAPSLTAGTTNIQAGAFTPFTTTLGRQDDEQTLSGVRLRMPPGLLGQLASVKQCPEPQASLGTCGPESLIGHTVVSAGLGTDPFTVSGGQVFITGPYRGAPFGLSIAVPAKAGPFDIGSGPCDCVVVRARVDVDPHTAQIVVLTDALPTILQGIPLQVKHVNVTIDRPGFMFNPTSCDRLNVTGTLTGGLGANASATVPFQVANCQGLAFKPVFKVSTQARTSKKNGASLDVKLGYPKGSQANIRSVAVTLPKQLPSRLTTIQQACPEAAFQANPASCPAGSVIGTATARTPVLTSIVSGPAYLVSHGGAAFPDVVLVLQGEGITLELVGSINIKKSITSSAFNSVPDAPISSFELSLPEGPHSGLAAVVPAKAKGNLCGQSLVMPTTMTGQNGARIKQNTKIQVTGCPKAKKKHKPKHTRGPHGKQHKKK